MRSFNSDHKHLVPATPELVQLNSKWQRMIKSEKDRRRNASLMEPTNDIFSDNSDADKIVPDGTVEDNVWSVFDSYDPLLDSRCILPVTKIAAPNEITRENIVQQFTLNKNQRAAFMIITGHLDGADKLNGGMLVE